MVLPVRTGTENWKKELSRPDLVRLVHRYGKGYPVFTYAPKGHIYDLSMRRDYNQGSKEPIEIYEWNQYGNKANEIYNVILT